MQRRAGCGDQRAHAPRCRRWPAIEHDAGAVPDRLQCLHALPARALLRRRRAADAAAACSKDKQEETAQLTVPRRVPDTNSSSCCRRAGSPRCPTRPLPPPQPEGPSWRCRGASSSRPPGTPARGMMITPVLHARGTLAAALSTGVDYPWRSATNQAALGPPSATSSRTGSIRGAPELPCARRVDRARPGWSEHRGQPEALPVPESVTTPDKRQALTGCTIVITLEKAEFKTRGARHSRDACGRRASTSGPTVEVERRARPASSEHQDRTSLSAKNADPESWRSRARRSRAPCSRRSTPRTACDACRRSLGRLVRR